MAILHLVNQSPFESHSLKECLAFSNEHDIILLMGDATYALCHQELSAQLSQTTVVALHDDCLARGLTVDESPCRLIDYDEFVRLTLKYSPTVSWYKS